MNDFRFIKYLSVLTLPFTVYIAFVYQGWWSFLPLIYAFGIVPLLELFLKPDHDSLDQTTQALIKEDFAYDLIVYMIVPMQLAFLFFFLTIVATVELAPTTLLGLTVSMGIMCGVFGINVGHELGHRSKKYERIFAKILLMTSLYMHFYIEHNRGHHKHVATHNDPASARYNENIYCFFFRSIVFSYISAWRIEIDRLKKKALPIFSPKNEMLLFHFIQGVFLAAIWYFFGNKALFSFLGAASIGILLLEAVNYIEHYGLERQKTSSDHYERVKPHHSWNSDHIVGRVLLFELSRHSDHHYLASKKYQTLTYHEDSPQMPTGYPGMIITALIPPLWFRIMHPLIQKQQV